MIQFVKALADMLPKGVIACSARPGDTLGCFAIRGSNNIAKAFGDCWGSTIYGDWWHSLKGIISGKWKHVAEIKFDKLFAKINKVMEENPDTVKHVFFVGDDGQGDVHTAFKWYQESQKSTSSFKFRAYIRKTRRENGFQPANSEFGPWLDKMGDDIFYFENAAEATKDALEHQLISLKNAIGVYSSLLRAMLKKSENDVPVENCSWWPFKTFLQCLSRLPCTVSRKFDENPFAKKQGIN